MKKLVCILMAVFLCYACQKKETQRYFSESPEIESSKKLLGYFAAYDYEGIKAIYSDSVKIYDNSVDPISLTDLLKDVMANEAMVESMKVQDSAEFEMVLTKENETWVNCWYTIVGRFKGLDKNIAIPCHSTFQFEDGKVIKEYSYYNTLPVYQEMEKLMDTTLTDSIITDDMAAE